MSAPGGTGRLIEGATSPARRGEMPEDPADLPGIADVRKHLHRGAAATAAEEVDLVDLGEQSCPGGARLPRRDGVLAQLGGVAATDGGALLVLPPATLGGRADEVGFAGPRTAGA